MPITYIIIAINVIISLWAFSNIKHPLVFRRHLFIPSEVAKGQNLIGILLSNFSHADIWHLIFNMMTLFFFGPVVEQYLGYHF